jgi:hypothetical protein
MRERRQRCDESDARCSRRMTAAGQPSRTGSTAARTSQASPPATSRRLAASPCLATPVALVRAARCTRGLLHVARGDYCMLHAGILHVARGDHCMLQPSATRRLHVASDSSRLMKTLSVAVSCHARMPRASHARVWQMTCPKLTTRREQTAASSATAHGSRSNFMDDPARVIHAAFSDGTRRGRVPRPLRCRRRRSAARGKTSSSCRTCC